MTITPEQLDELERKLNERLYIPSKATWSVLIAIARAALAYRDDCNSDNWRALYEALEGKS